MRKVLGLAMFFIAIGMIICCFLENLTVTIFIIIMLLFIGYLLFTAENKC